MKIGVIGGGVVGQATARTWLEHCDEVRVFDMLKERRTHELSEVMACDLTFVCVPETAVERLFDDLFKAHHFSRAFNLVVRSTVPVGTTRKLAQGFDLRNLVHSPEFLTERCAHTDAQMPSRNIVGIPEYTEADCQPPANGAAELLTLWYSKRFPGVETYVMSSDDSESVKLWQNSFFAVKVALFNEFWQFAKKRQLHWDAVRVALLADGRIGEGHTRVPGPDSKFGFGGKCLPKDLKQFIRCMEEAGVEPWVCQAAYDRNEQIDRERP